MWLTDDRSFVGTARILRFVGVVQILVGAPCCSNANMSDLIPLQNLDLKYVNHDELMCAILSIGDPEMVFTACDAAEMVYDFRNWEGWCRRNEFVEKTGLNSSLLKYYDGDDANHDDEKHFHEDSDVPTDDEW